MFKNNFFIEFLSVHYSVILTVVYIVISSATILHILLKKEDLKNSIAWIGLVILSPIVGAISYVFLGINRIKRKGLKIRGKERKIQSRAAIAAAWKIFQNFSPSKKSFLTFTHNVYSKNFSFDTSIEILQNGKNAYPEMINVIKNAKKEVLLSTYIFDVDEETKKFITAFKMALANGAKVKVLVDGVGTFHFFTPSVKKVLSRIKGIEYAVFLPLKTFASIPFANLRNHRKIMIVDGKTAFFGGMNISKNNVLIEDIKKGIIDITFKVQGPVLKQMAEVFEDDWNFTSKETFRSIVHHSIETDIKINTPSRIIPNGPDEKESKIEIISTGAINCAEQKISIVSPYFLPENNILTSLEIAAMRGVEVEIIIPHKSNHFFMDWAATPSLEKLLKRGIKIYKTFPPFDHSKIFIVDNEWCFIGSANWDARSFRLNFESNMEIFDKQLAFQLTSIIDEKKRNAKLLELKDLQDQKFLRRIRDNLFRLLTPYY
jgi:cardiolipin synthase